MAKTKRKTKKKSNLDNLQMKPIIIAFFAGMFLGIQTSNAPGMAMLALGIIVGGAAGAAIYHFVILRNDNEEKASE